MYKLSQQYLDTKMVNKGFEGQNRDIRFDGVIEVNKHSKINSMAIKNPGAILPKTISLTDLFKLIDDNEYEVAWLAINWDATP